MIDIGLPSKIQDYLKNHRHDGPVLVLDLARVEAQFNKLKKAMPDIHCHYAVKANPAPEILALLAKLGSKFDSASRAEIEMVLKAGAKPTDIIFGNTIKRAEDIRFAHEAGVEMYACDSLLELEKIAQNAPGAKIFARIRVGGEFSAGWPLSKKFGCTRDVALEMMVNAKARGLTPYGISFHVGSQQTITEPYFASISLAQAVYDDVLSEGIELQALNLGGGFPVPYRTPVPPIEDFAEAIHESVERHFPNKKLHLMMEPGRYMVAEAGAIQSEVLLISRNKEMGDTRWVYLDIGKFSGLTEAEAIQYKITTTKGREDEGECGRVILAGPTCDSIDIIYEETEYYLPKTLGVGDKLYFLNAGAYTTTYSSVGFNGFPPLTCKILP